MLTDTLKAFINGLFWESFDLTFMENIKNYFKKSYFSIFL